MIERCRLQTADQAVPPAQTNIVTDGFRSLAEGEQVEFVVDQSDDGRPKAIEVTGPGGANPQVCGVLSLGIVQGGKLIRHSLLLLTGSPHAVNVHGYCQLTRCETHTLALVHGNHWCLCKHRVHPGVRASAAVVAAAAGAVAAAAATTTAAMAAATA